MAALLTQRFMGTYLEVLIRIMYKDVTRFMAVFMVFVLAFGGGLYFALRGEPCGLYQNNLSNGTDLLFSVALNTSHCLHPDETRLGFYSDLNNRSMTTVISLGD